MELVISCIIIYDQISNSKFEKIVFSLSSIFWITWKCKPDYNLLLLPQNELVPNKMCF